MKYRHPIPKQQFIYFDGCGEIQCLTAGAKRWLEAYFPSPLKAHRLPRALLQWIRQKRSRLTRESDCEPLVFRNDKRYLLVQFANNNPRNDLLLLSEGKIADKGSKSRSLTLREQEVLSWISGGKTNPEIAMILCVSIRTVHKHVERILSKLGVETRGAAAAQVLHDVRPVPSTVVRRSARKPALNNSPRDGEA